MSGDVLIERDGEIMVITLNRPHRRNAIDLATAEELASALDLLDDSSAARVGILAGAGGTFCAGMDLKAFAESGERPITERRGGLGMVRRPPDKPMIAAVEGAALGGGFELALACDLIVCSEDTIFGFPEVLRGQIATSGGALRLARRIPYHVALEILLTGDAMSAAQARAFGLVSRVVPVGGVMDAARELAARVALGAPLAVAATKRVAVHAQDWALDEQFDRQWSLTEAARDSHDAAEGARAFAEKRAPVWTGV